jgi:prefoldin subunit 5
VENAKAVHVDTNVALERSQASNEARITEQAEQLTQRVHKMEIRLEDLTNRVASLQIKR